MGCTQTKSDPAALADKSKSAEVDRMLKQQQAKDDEVIKMLLLGAGESGKSTLFKQMNTLYGKGFSHEERVRYRSTINTNILTACRVLAEQLDELKVEVDLSSRGRAARDLLLALPQSAADSALAAEVVAAIGTFWEETAVQQVYERRSEFQLDVDCGYFMPRVETVCAEDYIPTEQDILHTRVRTTGIVQQDFVISDVRFQIFDVGGQRSERRKWMACFDKVSAVIFVAAVSEYDQTLLEDPTVNRLHEALNLFESICNSSWFKRTSMILFLNKRDLFQEKIKAVPLTSCFPDYEGKDGSYKQAINFIEQQFLALNQQDKQIYSHVTCATDTDNVSHVFNSVKDIVIKKSLEDAGLIA